MHMTLSKIHYAKPSITDKEVEYVTDAARNGWAEKCFDYIIKFKKAFGDYLGMPYVIPTSSCTGALHMALAALDVGAGDEVIVPDVTWIASVSPITYLGATPVLVDILPDTWCIDPAAIERAITPKTRAIICVHIYGNLCEMDEIMAIAKKYNLPVIEDTAEALGSKYKGRMAGSIGDMSTFSFHGTKTITTGEGGALAVRDKALFDKLSILESHGRDPKVAKQFWSERIGYKYKMSNIEAALGLAQIERIEELVERKREIFAKYKARLGRLNTLSFNPEQPGCRNSYWMATAIFDKSVNLDRLALIKKFEENNIDARVFFYPVSMMPVFEKEISEKAANTNKVGYDIHARGMNLPCYHDITDADIDRVCTVIEQYLGAA
jgi:perosamine synthetase